MRWRDHRANALLRYGRCYASRPQSSSVRLRLTDERKNHSALVRTVECLQREREYDVHRVRPREVSRRRAPSFDPLVVVRRVAQLAVELLTQLTLFIKTRRDPFVATTGAVEVADGEVVPAQLRREHRPRPAPEVDVGRIATNAAEQRKLRFNGRHCANECWIRRRYNAKRR